MRIVPVEFVSDLPLRFDKIRMGMREASVEAVLIADNSNIYYATGRFFRGYVFLAAEGDPIYFVIRPNNFEADENVVYIRKPEQIAGLLAERGLAVPKTLGLELDSLTWSDAERLRKAFPGVETANVSGVLRDARMVKTPLEIKLMETDGKHQAEVYKRITSCYRPEMTDVELQIEIERLLRMEGCLGRSRMSGNLMEINLGSVLAGDNADYPSPYEFAMGGKGVDPSLPGGADGTVIRQGLTVMVDMNGSFNGYQSDMTRVWACGEVPEQALRAHECSRRILRELEKMGKPGVACCDLYNRAMEIAREENLSEYFMGHTQQAAFIGHGVGIQLNEMPVLTARYAKPLAENMTIAIEPKFVVPGVGAVGVENTYVVTPEGLRSITIFPEEIQEF